MAQKIKLLAAQLDGLSLMPGTHMVEGENQVEQTHIFLSLYTHALIHPHTLIYNK